MLALFILVTFTGAGYLLYTSSVTAGELQEMLSAEEWY